MKARIEVSARRIAANAGAARAKLRPGCELMAVVKGAGYGLGAAAVAKASGARWFGVGTLDEAAEVREACPGARIVLLLPCEDPVPPDITPTVYDDASARRQAGRPVWLKVDTGLHRMGFPPEAVPPAPNAEVVYSTLAEADAFAREQLRRLRQGAARVGRPVKLSLATTVGHDDPELQLDFVRVGLGLVRGAARFVAPVVAVRDVAAGEGVGYGHLFRLERPGRVATVLAGWEQGVPRALSNTGEVVGRGVRRRILGRVSMNHLMIDGQGLEAGDEVELLGDAITEEDWARWAGTSPYEILVRLGARVPRLPV
jgi:alanine racemase